MPKKVKPMTLNEAQIFASYSMPSAQRDAAEKMLRDHAAKRKRRTKKPAPGKPVELSREDWKIIKAACLLFESGCPDCDESIRRKLGPDGLIPATRGVSPAKGK